MVLTRAIAVYGLGFLSNSITASDISTADQAILWWGGLRGSVSIALALSIPEGLSDREGIIATVFGAVLFTLLVQGLTIPSLLKRMNVVRRSTCTSAIFRASSSASCFKSGDATLSSQ